MSIRSNPRWVPIILSALTVVLSFLGVPMATATETTQAADLDPALERLLEADKPAAFAETRDLNYRNDTVRVVIELEENATLPDNYTVQIEESYQGAGQNLVQAYVPLDQLRPLAAESTVTYVRPPQTAVPDAEGTVSTAPDLETDQLQKPSRTQSATPPQTEDGAADSPSRSTPILLGLLAVVVVLLLGINRWRGSS